MVYKTECALLLVSHSVNPNKYNAITGRNRTDNRCLAFANVWQTSKLLDVC